MATKRNSTTTLDIPAEGKFTHYDREAGCIAGYYNGNLTGYYRNESEAHEALDDIAYAALTHPHTPVEELVEDYRDELATSADLDAFVAEWNADAEAEHDAILAYADTWNADAYERTPALVALLPGDVVLVTGDDAVWGGWSERITLEAV